MRHIVLPIAGTGDLSSWTPKPWLPHHDQAATDTLNSVLSSGQYDQLLTGVQDLLERGAHPDGPKRDGMHLRLAINLRMPSIVADLLSYGADPNARLFDEEPPVRHGSQPWNNCETVLHWAVYRGGYFEQLYRSHEHLKCILQLIAAGADTKARSRFGVSCHELAITVSKGSSAIERALDLPLHAAVAINDSKLCLDLLAAGFDPEAKNARRQTAWRNAELNSSECHAAMSAWRASAVIRNIKDASMKARP